MSNNRIEQQALINNLSATVNLAADKAARRVDGFVFKKDVTGTNQGTSGAINVSFSTLDLVSINLIGNATISISAIEEGQRGKLHIVKNQNTVVSFSGATLIGGQQVGLTLLIYEVVNYYGDVYVRQVNNQSFATIGLGEVSMGTGVLNAVNYFNVMINGNIAQIEAGIVFTTTAAGLISYDLTIVNSVKIGRFYTANKYIPIAMSHDYSSKVADVGIASIKDDGSDYIIRMNKSMDASWPSSAQVIARFNGSILIK